MDSRYLILEHDDYEINDFPYQTTTKSNAIWPSTISLIGKQYQFLLSGPSLIFWLVEKTVVITKILIQLFLISLSLVRIVPFLAMLLIITNRKIRHLKRIKSAQIRDIKNEHRVVDCRLPFDCLPKELQLKIIR